MEDRMGPVAVDPPGNRWNELGSLQQRDDPQLAGSGLGGPCLGAARFTLAAQRDGLSFGARPVLRTWRTQSWAAASALRLPP